MLVTTKLVGSNGRKTIPVAANEERSVSIQYDSATLNLWFLSGRATIIFKSSSEVRELINMLAALEGKFETLERMG